MNGSDLFQLKNVGKHFGRTVALHSISLTLETGQRWAVLGRNGAGKSCLLRILAHLMRPSEGDILFQGHPVNLKTLAGFRRKAGYLSHQPGLYSHLSARENLLFFAQMFALENIQKVVSRALEEFHLSDRADEPVRHFSRGMLQRLALARSLLHQPRVILLDEPFTGLDTESARHLKEAIERRNPDLLVLSTHQPQQALGLVNQVLLLEQGQVSKISTMDPDNINQIQG
jgi:heme exporter protein A